MAATPANRRRASKLVACKDNGRGFPVGFIIIGGYRYRLEPSHSKKEGVMGWVKITRLRAVKGKGGPRRRPATRRSSTRSSWKPRGPYRGSTRRSSTRRRTSRPRNSGRW